MQKPRIIAVTYHLGRTGSSAMMGLLRLCGCNVGELKKVVRPRAMNPKGFFESKRYNQFLAAVYPGIYPQISRPPTRQLMQEVGRQQAPALRQLLREEFGESYPLAIKAPRLLTLPLLHELRDEMDIRVIVLTRDLDRQTDSIHRVWQAIDDPQRQNASRQEIADWITQWADWTAEARQWFDLPMLDISFEKLMESPAQQTQIITQFCDLPMPSLPQIDRWLDRGLINRSSLDDNTLHAPTADSIKRRPERVFVLADSRSGSNWLIETLDQHPDIIMFKELYNPNYNPDRAKSGNRSNKANALKRVLGLNLRRTVGQTHGFYRTTEEITSLFDQQQSAIVGCKVLFQQLLRWGDPLSFFQTFADSRFIVLTRQNDVAAEVSNAVAIQHGRWHVREQSQQLQTVTLDPVDFRRRLDWRQHARTFVCNMLESFAGNRLNITYETLFAEPGLHLRRIAAFCDVDSLPALAGEQKANPFTLRNLIENYDEIKAALADHPRYVEMLES